jgi:hypothetical protein
MAEWEDAPRGSSGGWEDAPKQKQPKDRTYSEAFQDVGAKALSGVGGLAQLPGQLYGLATGNFEDTGLYGAGKKLEQYGESLVSPSLKAKEAATQQKIAEAEKQGQLAAFKTGVSEVATDPAQLTAFLAQQVPQAIPSLLAAIIPGVGPAAAAEIQAAQAAARVATSSAAKAAATKALEDAVANAAKSSIQRGTSAAVRTAAVQQGADIGTGAYEGIYNYMIEKGATKEEAAAEAINRARLAGAGGAALSLLAQRLPGAQAFERALAGERTGAGRLVGAGLGAIKEIPGEGVEEVGGKLLQNIAQQQVNPEQSLSQGLGATAAQATIGAAGMGGLGGLMSGRATPEQAPAQSVEEELLALGMSQPFVPVKLPDGSVARTQQELDAFNEEQQRSRLAIGAEEPFEPVRLPDGSMANTREELHNYRLAQQQKVINVNDQGIATLTPEDELKARYAPQKTEEALGEEADIETKFSRYNQGLKAAKEMRRAGQISEEKFNQFQNQYDQFRQEYDAYKERTAKPLTPIQKEAADIADKLEMLGGKDVAGGIRGAIKMGSPLTQDNIQFYNEKLAEYQARKAEEGQRIEETHTLSNYMEGDKDIARLESAIASKNKDVSETVKAADEYIQKLTAAINQAGYKVDAIGSNSPAALRELKSHMQSLAGIAHRLTMEEESTSKGYKRAAPEKLARAIAETKADIAKAQALIENATTETNELVQPPEVAQAEKDIAAAEMKARKLKRESMSLWTALTGKLAASEVRDIFSKKPTFGQRSLQTQNGAQVSDLVSDGVLDQFLPPNMRHDSPTFDEQASTQRIKDKLGEQNYISFDAEMEIETIFGSIREAEELIRDYLSAEEANKLIQEAQSEQDRANRNAEEIVTKGATGAPEGISTQDLTDEAKRLGVDVDAVAQEVARQAEDMTQEQYNAELRKALTSAINSAGGESVTLASVSPGEKGFTATKEELQMQKDLLGKDMIQAAQYVIKNAPNAFYKFVGNKVLQKLKKMQDAGVTLTFGVEAGNRRNDKLYRSNGITTFFQSKDGRPSSFRILLNGAPVMENQNGYPSGMNYKTLMHELLHVATQAEIQYLNYTDANNPAVGELKRLYNKVADEFRAQEKAGTLPQFLVDFRKGNNNALESVDEMLTWSMTDERMQKWMSEIKVGEKTLFSKIIDLIRSVMGIAKPYETALDRLVRTTEQIIDIDTQETADGMSKRGYYYGPKEGIKRQPKEQQSLFSRAAQAMMDEDTKELRLGKEEKAPTPTGAGAQSMKILNDMGRGNQEAEAGYAQKIRQSWDNARDNPKATMESAKAATSNFLDRLETWTFSSDAALNNRIRDEVKKSTLTSQEKIGMLLNTSLSQTVHSDAVASLFLQRGGIKYNEELHKWEGVDNQSNFVKLSKQLDAMAEKNGLTKQQAELVAHTAFEAKRLRSLVRFNQELDDKVEAVRKEAAAKRNSSPVAASALSKEASRLQEKRKFISPEQEAMIAPGMELFKIHPELNDVVKTWNEIRTSTVKTLVDTGLWSENEAEEMLSNADYVPFYREEQLENNQGPKGFISGLQVKAKEHRLKGSNRPVNDIFDNQVRWVQYSINRAVRNRSALALADTAVEVGAAKQVKSKQDGNNVVRVWRNGEEQFYDMDDPMFMEAFTGLEAIVIPSWKWASNMANVLRQSVVMYPLFSVAQVPQDSFAAIFSSGLKPQYALRIPVLAVKEFVQTLRGKSKTHEELKNVGAVGVRDFTSAMVRMDAEIYAGLRAPPGVLGKIKYGLNHIAMAADNAVRQAVYEASIAQGVSRAEAMEKAFEVFNVRRRGSSKSLALAGQLIPFFNAYLAAQNVAYKTITGRGISPTERQDAFKTLAATTASVMALSLMYAMLNGDDEDYLKKPATVRDRLLMIPGTGGMSIPLRADLFTMPKIITEHMYLMMTDKGYEDGRKFRDSMKAALGSAVLGPTAVPQAIKPLVEVGINYDFFQGRPLIGTYQQKLDTERQFTDSTSELGKILGKTGLVSPIAADHLIRGMFGSAGGLIIYATNPMLHSDPNSPRPSLSERDAIAALPGMGGFMMKSYESALKKDFYTLKEEVDKAANTMNDLKTRSPQDIQAFLGKEENLARVGLQKSVNMIGERLSNIRKTITQITNSSMPADQKQQQIEMLRQAEEEMLKGVNVKMLRELGKI